MLKKLDVNISVGSDICFAVKSKNKCSILCNTECDGYCESCSFRKTNAQFNADNKRAAELLFKRGLKSVEEDGIRTVQAI